MGTSDRIGALRAQVLPHVLRHVHALDPAAKEDELDKRAKQTFDRAFQMAEHYRQDHPHEGRDMSLPELVRIFKESAGIPDLDAIILIDELVFANDPPAH